MESVDEMEHQIGKVRLYVLIILENYQYHLLFTVFVGTKDSPLVKIISPLLMIVLAQ